MNIDNYKPFRQSKITAAEEFNIIFVADPLDEKTKVMALRTDTNELRVHGREIYWLRRTKPGLSTFSSVVLFQKARRSVTIRGSQTVEHLAANYSPSKLIMQVETFTEVRPLKINAALSRFQMCCRSLAVV